MIAVAWVIVSPELLTVEIEKGLKRLGITQQFFTFKIMTPIYPDDLPKLTDPDFYSRQPEPYSFPAERKKEKQVIKNIKPLLDEFQIKANFSRK